MFGVDTGELFIIILVAVVVIGPKDLPGVMRKVGRWVGQARGMANQFRSGVDQMMRDSEIAELEQKWREQNEAIMRAHPMAADGSGASGTDGGSGSGADSDWGLASAPAADPPLVSLDKPAAAMRSADPAPIVQPPVNVEAPPAPFRVQPPSLVPLPVKPAPVAARAAGGEAA